MDKQFKLIKAIQKGSLAEVKALLDSDATVLPDINSNEPNLELGLACLMGHTQIIHELVARGASVHCADGNFQNSPMGMALRGNKIDSIRALIELGAEVPAGTHTGLSEYEITIAHLKAVRDGYCKPEDTSQEKLAKQYEEIHALPLMGTDTNILELDILRNLRH